MPTLTFTLADAGLAHLGGRNPRLFFVPERPATTPAHLVTRDPVEATISPAGLCTATVVASDETVPPTRYTLRATWDVGYHLDVMEHLAITQGVSSLWEALLATGAAAPYAPVMYGFGPPPAAVAGVLYIDISGVAPVLYAPADGGI